MSRTIALFLSLILSIGASAQERVTKQKPTFGNFYGELTSATGWLLNPDDEWLSLNNTIPYPLESRYKNMLSYDKYGIGSDNFIFYELREILYNETSYSILIKKYRDGHYKYKNIKEGWLEYTSHVAYVFENSQLDKLLNIVDSKPNLIEIQLIDIVAIRGNYGNNVYSIIPTKIKWNEETNAKLILHISPYKEKNIVQFQIYTSMGYDIITGINSEYRPKQESEDYFKAQIYLKDNLFKYCYFEIDYSTFSSFLKLP